MKEENWLEVYKALVDEIASQCKGEELYKKVKVTLEAAGTVLESDELKKLKNYACKKGYAEKTG